jgi:hypothetical protein
VRASSHKVGSCCMLGVVDGITDLPCYVPKVAGIASLGLGLTALLDHPQKAYGA